MYYIYSFLLCFSILINGISQDTKSIRLLNNKEQFICDFPLSSFKIEDEYLIVNPGTNKLLNCLDDSNLTHGIVSIRINENEFRIYIMSITSSWLSEIYPSCYEVPSEKGYYYLEFLSKVQETEYTNIFSNFD